MTMSEQEENDEINEEIEQGWRKIRENDKKIRDVLSQISTIRAETEEIRRENAKVFHQYKHKLGTKGNNILEKLYFHDYPTIEDVEKAVESQAAILALDYSDAELEKMTDEEIEKIIKAQKFFQTELVDSDSESDADPELAALETMSEKSEISKKKKSKPKNDIIQRNIRLAGGEGDILTPEERKRIEFIMETIDELEGTQALVEKEESSVDERLSKIDRLLESRFSRTTPAIDYQAMSLTECKAQLEDIESRLAILDENPDSRLSDFRSSTLLAIADIEDNDSEDRLLPRDEIKTLLANLQPTSELVPRDQIDKLLEQAKTELDL